MVTGLVFVPRRVPLEADGGGRRAPHVQGTRHGSGEAGRGGAAVEGRGYLAARDRHGPHFGSDLGVMASSGPVGVVHQLRDGEASARCKRRITFSGGAGAASPYHQQQQHHGGGAVQPASVARRNARERNRVKQVNNGFATLRQHIPVAVAAALASPQSPGGGRQAGKKLSKVETLRLAVEYIRGLQALLDEHDGVVTGAATSSLSPPASSGSPTPSFASDGSYHGGAGNVASTPSAYDGYEPMSPEDEELLDVISWWQQSQ